MRLLAQAWSSPCQNPGVPLPATEADVSEGSYEFCQEGAAYAFVLSSAAYSALEIGLLARAHTGGGGDTGRALSTKSGSRTCRVDAVEGLLSGLRLRRVGEESLKRRFRGPRKPN